MSFFAFIAFVIIFGNYHSANATSTTNATSATSVINATSDTNATTATTPDPYPNKIVNFCDKDLAPSDPERYDKIVSRKIYVNDYDDRRKCFFVIKDAVEQIRTYPRANNKTIRDVNLTAARKLCNDFNATLPHPEIGYVCHECFYIVDVAMEANDNETQIRAIPMDMKELTKDGTIIWNDGTSVTLYGKLKIKYPKYYNFLALRTDTDGKQFALYNSAKVTLEPILVCEQNITDDFLFGKKPDQNNGINGIKSVETNFKIKSIILASVAITTCGKKFFDLL